MKKFAYVILLISIISSQKVRVSSGLSFPVSKTFSAAWENPIHVQLEYLNPYGENYITFLLKYAYSKGTYTPTNIKNGESLWQYLKFSPSYELKLYKSISFKTGISVSHMWTKDYYITALDSEVLVSKSKLKSAVSSYTMFGPLASIVKSIKYKDSFDFFVSIDFDSNMSIQKKQKLVFNGNRSGSSSLGEESSVLEWTNFITLNFGVQF